MKFPWRSGSRCDEEEDRKMDAIEARAPLLPDILSLHGKWQSSKPAIIFGDRFLTWADFARAASLAEITP